MTVRTVFQDDLGEGRREREEREREGGGREKVGQTKEGSTGK